MLQHEENPHPPLPVEKIIDSVDELAKQKRSLLPLPIPHHVHEQIAFSSQYAILSHRWEQDDQELSFREAVKFPRLNRSVIRKKGFKKLTEFLHVVQSLYGCRYLWMDSICISNSDRGTSIPLMFDWYRRAYVCVVYLSTGLDIWADPWSKRGWTLQEYLAARRIKTVQEGQIQIQQTARIDAARDAQKELNLQHSRERPQGRWYLYRPEVEQAVWLFRLMISRETKRPEDKAYCLFSALHVDIPIKYGEGFDNAFYRLQIACLSQAETFDLLLWNGHVSSPRNSLLARDFTSFTFIRRYEAHGSANRFHLNSEGVICIFVPLIPWDITGEWPLRERWFAVLGDFSFHSHFVGVLLERLHGSRQVYRRIRLEEYKPPKGFVLPVQEWVHIM
ncbi:hypothetical protein BDN71DRAFT_1398714 [Pleurotus eryngii]|uniref:Heterokaryon incompatibility domain-containing protein n=1 Tax=Pleurotus eryngii TaxID=5323 RepID=A0A9P5ZPG7_PLEER|nr:hypothetical protein BDN71DRAFT_1398714 [Pleurotus eryngii]